MFDDKLFLKKPKKMLKYYPDRKKTQKFVIKLCDPSKFVPDWLVTIFTLLEYGGLNHFIFLLLNFSPFSS